MLSFMGLIIPDENRKNIVTSVLAVVEATLAKHFVSLIFHIVNNRLCSQTQVGHCDVCNMCRAISVT